MYFLFILPPGTLPTSLPFLRQICVCFFLPQSRPICAAWYYWCVAFYWNLAELLAASLWRSPSSWELPVAPPWGWDFVFHTRLYSCWVVVWFRLAPVLCMLSQVLSSCVQKCFLVIHLFCNGPWSLRGDIGTPLRMECCMSYSLHLGHCGSLC